MVDGPIRFRASYATVSFAVFVPLSGAPLMCPRNTALHGPAPCKNNIRILPIQLPVSGIAVADNHACEVFQEFSRVIRFAGPLIFIQDDGRIFVHLPSAINPHITLAVCGTPILRYHDRSFVGLQHMETIQFFMEIIIKDSQIPVRTLDHPVRHHLLGNVDVVPQEFLTDPV